MVTSHFFFIFLSSLKYSPQEPSFLWSENGKGEDENELHGVRLELEYSHRCELMIPNTERKV